MNPFVRSSGLAARRAPIFRRTFATTSSLNQTPKKPQPKVPGKSFEIKSTRISPVSVISNSVSFIKSLDNQAVKSSVEIDPIFNPRFELNQTYDPFNFSMTHVKMQLNSGYRPNKSIDAFAHMGVDPLDLWKEPEVLNNFVTSNGKIIQGVLVGNNGKTHKRVSKAIRRARAAGLMPYFHKSSVLFDKKN